MCIAWRINGDHFSDELHQLGTLVSPRRKVLVTHENLSKLLVKYYSVCDRGAWLIDEVINVYLELLKERERRETKKYLNCQFFNTFLYKKQRI
ncbi:ubiquitin-like-specific protease ESD4 [Silene latifolia]|uniref:ubiquitin-like-specific protease ESD4 n=1 Tax=Silene latifolia TaxID=37657 RepID=UPI003D76DE1F